MLNRANGFKRSDLDQIHADTMDVERIRNLIGNIDKNIDSLPQTTCDLHKLRDLKSFFQAELRKRGF